MTLQQLSKTVDFVQATTPSNANDGETWLDTSQSPPQLKVFDASASAFVRPRSIQNLDAPVSNAGATQSDIANGVDNSTTASTVSTNLDAPVSDAGKGVDWSTKTPKTIKANVTGGGQLLSITGSGIITEINVVQSEGGRKNDAVVTIDGVEVASRGLGSNIINLRQFAGTTLADGDNDGGTVYTAAVFDVLWAFSSSVDVSINKGGKELDYFGVINYVLD